MSPFFPSLLSKAFFFCHHFEAKASIFCPNSANVLIETWYNGHSSDVDDVVERRVARRDDVIFAEVVNQPVPEMRQH